jgi:membrane-bound lytic murein transglycosylase F
VDTVNYWIKKMKKYNDYYVIYDKYFKNSRSFSKRIESDFYSEKTGKISPYDELIKKYVEPTGWDWRLISSLVYQESRFDTRARSWASANGLMQLMPATAKEMGVRNMNDPEDNIRGGVRYLKKIYDRWENIEDSVQRLKFTFASYNCGYYHVIDAQKLAVKYESDPSIWDGSVEVQVLNLSYSNYYRDELVKYGYVRGREPVNYVFDIYERYEVYKQFIELD